MASSTLEIVFQVRSIDGVAIYRTVMVFAGQQPILIKAQITMPPGKFEILSTILMPGDFQQQPIFQNGSNF